MVAQADGDPTMFETEPEGVPLTNVKALRGAKLSDQCYMLADIAEPPNMKQAFDSSLSFALLRSQLDKVERATGLSLVTRNARGKPEVSCCC